MGPFGRRVETGYFFGFGGVATFPFWLGWEAFGFGACSFFDFPLLSFIDLFPAD